MPLEQTAVLVTIAVGVVGLLAGTWRLRRPVARFWHRMNGTFDAVVGRDAYTDPASGKQVEALPPLTTRVAHVEEAIVELRHVIGLTTEMFGEIRELKGRVQALEDARLERIVEKAESAQMWRAVADKDVPDDPEQP